MQVARFPHSGSQPRTCWAVAGSETLSAHESIWANSCRCEKLGRNQTGASSVQMIAAFEWRVARDRLRSRFWAFSCAWRVSCRSEMAGEWWLGWEQHGLLNYVTVLFLSWFVCFARHLLSCGYLTCQIYPCRETTLLNCFDFFNLV